MKLTKSQTLKADVFITQAESYLGYTTLRTSDSIFGERLNVNNLPWSGTFLDCVAREVDLELVSHITTSVALSYYINSGRFHVRPKRGDIVFLEVSTIGDYHQPQVGIVTDVSRWNSDGIIQTIEGQVSSGMPKKTDAQDGVYQRTRNQYDIIGFGRPNFSRKRGARFSIPTETASALPQVATAHCRTNSTHPSVELVQRALSQTVGLTKSKRGTFDGKTKVAYAKFQRQQGYPPSRATGEPDYYTLKALAELTGSFQVIN